MTDGTNYARVTCDQTGGDNLRGYCGEANARLIAAAPELLKALESVVEIWDHHCFAHGDGVPTPCHAQVRAAIAKAKGKA